jgi:cytochrome d ubiquinol oxidase subunit II
VFLCKTPQTELLAFLSSCVYLVGILASAAFGVYPVLLPASSDPALSLTIDNAAAGSYGLHIGLVWWIPGMFLTIAYAIFTYSVFSGKLSVGDAGAGADRHPAVSDRSSPDMRTADDPNS